MIQVALEHILPEEDAVSRVREIFDQVEATKETYVITKDDKPMFAIVDIDKLEALQASSATASTGSTPSAPQLPETPTAPVHTPPSTLSPTVSDLPHLEPLRMTPPPTTPLVNPVPPVSLPGSTPPPAAAPAPATPPTPAATPAGLPPLEGSLDLPNMPEDPSNSSPLA